MKNKDVRHGFSNVHYAMITDEGGTGTDGIPQYSEPVRIPGAVSFSPSRQGNKQNKWADNELWFAQTPNQGVSGDAAFAVLPKQFLIDAAGYIADDNGALFEVANAEQKPFAFMGEVFGAIEPIRFIYYFATASSPTDSYETDTEQYTLKDQTVTLTMSPVDLGVKVNGVKQLVTFLTVKRSENPTAFDTFFDEVYLPVVTS